MPIKVINHDPKTGDKIEEEPIVVPVLDEDELGLDLPGREEKEEKK